MDPVEHHIRKGIRDLKQMDVIVKQADKNLGMIPIRGDIYNAMVRGWLKKPSFRRVTGLPHEQLFNTLLRLVSRSNSLSPSYKFRMLSAARDNKEPAPFYVVPKIHKSKLGSRPITAQHSYMLSGVSKVLADVFNDYVADEATIGKDSKTTVGRLEELKLPADFVFLTYDVEACYPSIDLKDAISTLKDNVPFIQHIDNGVYYKLLELVMYNNFVTAKGKVYQQLIGTATGTQVAPPFANLYLHYKFKDVLDDDAIIFQERFIDDGLIIVKTKEDAERIMAGLQQSTNLNLTYDVSSTHAIYLDLYVYKGPRLELEKKLDMKVYFKPTNKMLYLPAISNHPAEMKSGIIRGEAIRTLRNTSSKAEWLKALSHIFKGLMARGYSPTMIVKKWKTVRFEDRDEYIHSTTEKRLPDKGMIRTRYNRDTLYWWRTLTARRPIETVLKRKRATWNKKQAEIITNWPPKVGWKDFRKVANLSINAKDTWDYVALRKRPGEELEGNPRPTRRARMENR